MQLNDLTDLKTGHLRVGGTHYFNAYILPLLLQLTKKSSRGSVFNLLKLVPGN